MDAAHRETHVPELVLRRRRAGELPEAKARDVEAHLTECEACRERDRALEREADAFFQRVSFDRFAEGVERRAAEAPGAGRTSASERARSTERTARAGRSPRPPRRVLRWAVPTLALAAAGLLVVLALPEQVTVEGGQAAGDGSGAAGGSGGSGGTGSTGGNRLKGGAEVDFYVGGAGATRVAASREMLAPGERIRIQVRPGAWSHVAVVSVDEAGEVSALYPEAGRALPAEGPTLLLPGSVAFSGEGLERVIVVLTDEAVPVDEVVREARDAYRAAHGDLTRMSPLEASGEELDRLFIKP